jgi:hypothetical protein
VSDETSAEVLAEVLAEHQWSLERVSCWCGWTPTDAVLALSSVEDQFFAHQAAAIIAAGFRGPDSLTQAAADRAALVAYTEWVLWGYKPGDDDPDGPEAAVDAYLATRAALETKP